MMTRVVLLLAAVIALVSQACSSDESRQDLSRCNAVANVEPKYPGNSFSDWVTFARQVSVVRVVGEERYEIPANWVRNEAAVSERWVVVRVEQTLWVHPDLDPLEGEISWKDWTLPAGEDPGACAYAMGGTYLVPLAEFFNEVGPMNVAPIHLEDGRLPAADQVAYPWLEPYSGASLAEIEQHLAGTLPGTPIANWGFSRADPCPAPVTHVPPTATLPPTFP